VVPGEIAPAISARCDPLRPFTQDDDNPPRHVTVFRAGVWGGGMGLHQFLAWGQQAQLMSALRAQPAPSVCRAGVGEGATASGMCTASRAITAPSLAGLRRPVFRIVIVCTP